MFTAVEIMRFMPKYLTTEIADHLVFGESLEVLMIMKEKNFRELKFSF
jgi:hypothetical protein